MKQNYSIKAQGTVAEIRITGDIGWWALSGADFTKQVDALILAGVRDVNGYINSGGGDVIDANEIYNQIKRFTGVKKGRIGAICGSAATVVSMAFDEISIARNGQYMIHNMQGRVQGEIKDLESYLQLMRNLTELYIDMYSEKTGLTKDVIKAMLDATTWLTAKQAKAKGFVDAIESDEADPEDIYAQVKNYGYANLPQAILNSAPPASPQNQNLSLDLIMKDQIISALILAGQNITASATDEQIVACIKKLAQDKKTAEDKVTEISNSAATAKAKILVDNLINSKKATEAERTQLMADATSNYEATERAYSKIPGVEKITNHFKPDENSANADRKDWKLKDWMEKDSKGLLKMRSEDKATYRKLYKEEYGMDCVLED